MNAVVLCMVMIVLTIFIYFRNTMNLISPSLWISGTFTISIIIYCICGNYFNEDLSLKVCFIIFLSVLFFACGEFIGSHVSFGIGKNDGVINKNPEVKMILLPKRMVICCFGIFIFCVAIYRYYTMYLFTRTYGNSNIFLTVYFIRAYMTSGEFSFNTIVSLLSGFAEAMGYIIIYYFLQNLIIKKKCEKRFIASILAYFFYLITTTGRTGFLKFFLITIALIYFFNRDIINHKLTRKLWKYFIIAMAAMILVFILYGKIVRKSDKNITDYFENYFAAGLFGLEYYNENTWESNQFFGQYTLSNYYYYANKIFKTNYPIMEQHLPFFPLSNDRSNIYTALVLPVQDYGVVGMLITRFFMGWFMIAVLQKAFRKNSIKERPIYAILFGYILYICFFFPVADRFKELLTVTSFPSFLLALVVSNNILLKYSIKMK